MAQYNKLNQHEMTIVTKNNMQTVKPIFHCDAKLLALGTFASPNAKDSTFASPDARIPTCWYLFPLGDANFLRRPCTFLFFCVDFICVV